MRKLTTGFLCLASLTAQANVIQYFAAGISYSNPSELFKIKESTFVIGGTGSYADLQFQGSVLNFNTFQYGSGTNSSREYTLLPYGRIGARINDKLVMALDVTEPYNSNLIYGDDAFTRYANTQNFLTDIDVSPKLSYALSQKLYVGGGLNFNFVKNNEVNFAYPTGPQTWATLTNRSHSFGLGYNLGATYLINQTNFLGILYYSPIQQNTTGTSTLGALYNPNFAVALKLPSTTSISYTHLFNTTWLLNLKAFQTGWSSFQTARLYNTAVPAPDSNFVFPMNFKDGYAYMATVRKQQTEKLGIAVHAMVDYGPEQDALRTLAFPSDNQYLVGASLDYHFNQKTSVELFYGHVFSNPTLQNRVTTPNGSIPFTTGRMDIDANVLDLKLRVEV